jgi:hypothetical protein
VKNSWSFISKNGYSIEETELCTWRLLLDGRAVLTRQTPYPLLIEAMKHRWMSYDEVLRFADILQIQAKFIQPVEEYGEDQC